jgi:hypothetical protein
MLQLKMTAEQVASPKFIEKYAGEKGEVDIQLADGHAKLPTQLCVLNSLLWPIYLHFNIPITKDRIFFLDRSVDKETGKASYSFTSDTVTRCTNAIYNELILFHRIPDHMEAVAQVWLAINRFSSFADFYTRQYQVSLDILSVAGLCAQSPLKEVLARKIDTSHGSKVAEQQFARDSKEMMALIAGDQLENNQLKKFMRTKLFNRNQVPQMLYAYGTRSDIDDKMMKHAISESAMSGLKSAEDFAIEALSAKKAEYFNSAVIQDAQYFARRVKLASTEMHVLHKGSCGSDVTLEVIIPNGHKYNYLGKFVRVDETTKHLLAQRKWPQYPEDDSIEITKDNIDLFVERPVQMWTVFGCRHKDGFCEHCAGYMHQKLSAYLPTDIHPGVNYATLVVSSVTQKILSAKHLIKTSSKEFNLPDRTMKFFLRSGDAIMWQEGAAKGIKKCKIRIENSNLLGPLNDLTRAVLPSGSNFSRISRIAIVSPKNEVIELLEMNDGTTFPYFSMYAMEYLRKHYKEIAADADYIDIPMDDFDFDLPMFLYTSTNDDMVSYVNRVEKFLMGADKGGIRTYTNIAACLRDFSELVYTKSDVSIFAIEVLLRCFLAPNEGEVGVPILTDLKTPVKFNGLSDVISDAALSTKLAFQGIKDFMRDPLPTLDCIGSGYGYYDVLFGFSRVI